MLRHWCMQEDLNEDETSADDAINEEEDDEVIVQEDLGTMTQI